MPVERMYRDLAWAWPIISPPDDYTSEAAMFIKALESKAKGPIKTLLDLGCGGGHNDFHFTKRYKVTGIDISEGMLSNARKLNPEVNYSKGDMRSARLGRQFDAVVIADSIMYMLSEEDMLAALRTAFEHLRPGGAFCTYAEEFPEVFLASTHTHESKRQGEVEITLIEHMWDPDPRDTTIELVFVYIISESGEIRVETDKHTCGIFPKKTWMRLLRQAGFGVETIQEPDEGIKTLFACTKP